MLLLDLPLELVERIVQHLITDFGQVHALQLRLVNHLFNDILLRDLTDGPANREKSAFLLNLPPFLGKWLHIRIGDGSRQSTLTSAMRLSQTAYRLAIESPTILDIEAWERKCRSVLIESATEVLRSSTALELLAETESVINKNEALHGALVIASAFGNHAAMEQLLKAGADLKHESRYFGAPLTAAVKNKQESMCGHLLGKGADVRYSGRTQGSDAFDAACARGYILIAKLLDGFRLRQPVCHFGDDVRPVVSSFWNGIATAFANHQFHLVDAMKAHSITISEHHWNIQVFSLASRYGHLGYLEKMISDGFDLHTCLHRHTELPEIEQPIRVAARYGHPDVVRLLLRSGNGPLEESWAKKVLIAAVISRNTETFEILFDQLISVSDIMDWGSKPWVYGNNPIERAIMLQNDIAVSSLLNISGTISSDIGIRLLRQACVKGYVFGVRKLLEAGVCPNSISNYEQRLQMSITFSKPHMQPLWLASTYEHYEIVELLLQYGAKQIELVGDSDRRLVEQIREQARSKAQEVQAFANLYDKVKSWCST
ncbi:ankyrin repeat-containing domain protein [Tricladium varicosporioides]|nr:ankyrin repeat-containing domain protein [Hymenoscyphus varicosporioides]